MQPADHADEDCDYQAGPVANKQRRETLAAFVGRAGKPRGEALDYCRGRTTTVSVYSKLHTGCSALLKPSILITDLCCLWTLLDCAGTTPGI